MTSSRTRRFQRLASLLTVAMLASALSILAATPVQAEVGVETDSTWAPFVGEFQMWCTKSTGVGTCASHHNGWAIDINMPFNEPIYATGSGEIVQFFGGCDPSIGYCNGGAGNWISIDHGDHWSRYIHLASFAPDIEIGDWLEAGDLVGFAGASGTSSGGSHLHYDETLPQSLPVSRIFFGPFLACHGDIAVQYPDVLGTTEWQEVPPGTVLRNDGYECLGGVTAEPPPPAPVEPAEPGGSVGLAIGDFLGTGYDSLAIGIPGEAIGTRSNAGMVTVTHSDADGLGVRHESLTQGKGLRGKSEPNDLAGAALATGDYNCDGIDDLAVGVPGEAIGTLINAGAVTVTYGSASSIKNAPVSVYQNNVVLPGPAEAGDLTGAALATGDFNGDGCDDLAVGAPGEDIDSIVDAGAVFVAYGAPGGFSASTASVGPLYQGGAIAGFTESGDLLGAVLAAGDFDCNGYDDLAIGVPREGVSSAINAGAVSVLFSDANGVGLSSTTIYQGSGLAGILESGDSTGSALAAGDFNGDGCDDLAVGAWGEDLSGGADAGAVSVVFGSSGGFAESSVHYQGGGGLRGAIEPGDRVGTALVAVDINCDGYDDLAVGAPGEGIGSKDDAGVVTVLGGSASGMTGTLINLYQNNGGLPGANEPGDRVGEALAAGDVNGDGCDDLAIGVPGEDIGSRVDAGAVVVIEGSATSIKTTSSFNQKKNLPGGSEDGDLLGGPSVLHLLGIAP